MNSFAALGVPDHEAFFSHKMWNIDCRGEGGGGGTKVSLDRSSVWLLIAHFCKRIYDNFAPAQEYFSWEVH